MFVHEYKGEEIFLWDEGIWSYSGTNMEIVFHVLKTNYFSGFEFFAKK